MTTTTHDQAPPGLEGGRLPWRIGDLLFYAITAAASLATLGLVVWLSFKVVAQAWGAIEEFGLSFIWTVAWDPVAQEFGALDFIYGTMMTSFIALLLATPLSLGIALFLTRARAALDPRAGRDADRASGGDPQRDPRPLGHSRLRPLVRGAPRAVPRALARFHPLFSGEPSQAGLLPAALVLTLMIVPITSSICRELFSRVPRDLSDGALALGATRWETIRGVSIPYAGPGIVAAVLLGLGRAFGEAIAVTQVIGSGSGFRPRSSSRPTRSPAGSRRSTRARSAACRSTRFSTSPRSCS